MKVTIQAARDRRAAKSLLLSIIVAIPGVATAASVPGFTHVKSLGGIEEYTLDANGLQVLIKPDHSAPVVTFSLLYRVGSRNEVTGTTGATHLLEHLMFKGTDAFNKGRGNSLDLYLEGVGSSYNATTSKDRTNYFATLGSDSLAGYVAIEADRMRNLWLHDDDRKSEMTVVRNEFERGENEPMALLMKAMYAGAFQAHPYHHSTIGWRADIENVPIGKLRDFYDTFYWPDNATAIFVGDVEPAAALQLIQKHFAAYSRSPKPIPTVYTEEPEQQGARRVIVKGTGRLGAVMIAHQVPNARHPDMAALDVLGSILTDGRSSRLYRALVDTGMALTATSNSASDHDASLALTVAQLAPGATHEAVEQALLTQLERVKKEGVSAQEVAAAIRRSEARLAFMRDGTSSVSYRLNEAVAAGDWTLFVTQLERLAKVQPADVQRVARTYFNEDQSTTGWFVPVIPDASSGGAAP